MKRLLTIFAVGLFLLNPILNNASDFTGQPESWTMDDFLGFDEVGDCNAITGDITSVFARIENNQLKLRVTFDNMVNRKDSQIISDHFASQNIIASVKILHKNTDQLITEQQIAINNTHGQSDAYDYLRTPGNNLLEVFFSETLDYSRGELLFEINIIVNGKPADSFNGDGNGSKDSGNCAFVHHGNQGLTYTDVFYGDPGGVGGLDESGFDEVLEVHRLNSLPGNFHMSGTLMPAAEWHSPEFNDTLVEMVQDGLVAMMTSALGQHIMPFVEDEMNNWSVHIESDMVEHMYGYTPHVAWVPERVWLASGYDPDRGIVDSWLGDNWEQHGVWAVVLDDWPHLNGYDNRKFHKMINGAGVELWVIPINNSFVGNMHYSSSDAKNQIASMGYGNICVYGTGWS